MQFKQHSSPNHIRNIVSREKEDLKFQDERFEIFATVSGDIVPPSPL